MIVVERPSSEFGNFCSQGSNPSSSRSQVFYAALHLALRLCGCITSTIRIWIVFLNKPVPLSLPQTLDSVQSARSLCRIGRWTPSPTGFMLRPLSCSRTSLPYTAQILEPHSFLGTTRSSRLAKQENVPTRYQPAQPHDRSVVVQSQLFPLRWDDRPAALISGNRER